jgi:Fungal specific transcription factor domain
VYRKDDRLKTRNTTLEILVQALLNLPDDEVPDLVKQIRTCESLDAVAEGILAKESGVVEDDDLLLADDSTLASPTFESHLSSKMGELRMEEGIARYIGGTSNLLFISDDKDTSIMSADMSPEVYPFSDEEENFITSWTTVTKDEELITHLMTMYFTWHYPYFTTLSKKLFMRDFKRGKQAMSSARREYCTPLLVNAILALGCHFTGWAGARENRDNTATAGDHFFKEAKRLIMLNDEYEKPKLATVQALALMSVREAGCGRESKGWVYSGMSFRMACDLGLNLDSGAMYGARESGLDDDEIDARRITFWGCYLFDK